MKGFRAAKKTVLFNFTGKRRAVKVRPLKRGKTMLQTRLMTAFFIILILVYCFSYAPNDIPKLVLLSLGVLLAGAEFVALRWHAIEGFAHEPSSRPPLRKEHFALGAAYALPLPLAAVGERVFGVGDSRSLGVVFAWLAFCMIASSAFFYRREIDLSAAAHKLMNGLAGFAYITVPGLTLFKLAELKIEGAPPAIAAYFSLAVVFMGDTGAYFVGKMFGKTKLIPKVSPKKTVEGALAGLVFSALTGVFVDHFFHLPFHWSLAALGGVLAGLAGQIGDLAESALKRASNCKDSGNLLPGHGGMLDRIDAVLFGVPFCYILFLLLI
jgi:phosphatidate cytidylyltransferase